MDAVILAWVAASLAAVGAVLRAVQREAAGALVAAGVALLAIAAAVGKL